MTLSPRYRALVYLSLAAAFLVVVWGGVVRVTGSGLGCPDWPLCHGQFLPSLDPATRIEWTHRFLAIVSGLTVAAMVLWTFTAYRADRRVLWLAIAIAVLYPLQGVLGGITVLLELPHEWVTLHLANAELLLAALTILAVLVRWPIARAQSGGWTWLALAAAIGTFVLLLSGAYVRAANATTACLSWPLCGAGDYVTPSGDAAIAMAHRVVAVGVGVIIVAACLEAWRHRREAPGLGPLAVSTVAIFVLQVAIGAANPLTQFSPWALGAHPAAASLLWCSVVALAAVAWHPAAADRALVRDLVALTKPAIMSLLLLTALGGMFLAARGMPPFGLLAATLIGGAAASGGASSLNHYFDRDLDERMRRTRDRPLPAHRIPTSVAVAWGIALNAVAFVVLALFVNLLAAALALAGTVFYILVYTIWLKRMTAQNIVIGGAAGAIPPLVGWAAITGSLDLAAWLLFAIIFFWTPAHFWALALLIRDDYERAGVPMLPVVRGDEATAWNILAYAASLLPLTLLLFIIGGLGYLYLAAAIVLGAVFIAYAVRLLRSGAARRRAVARGVYLYSLLYLALLFVAIMVDSTLRL
ncbi:MAG TPA: heme o synthase [Candidatus Limnocylindria bacterium]|jgi:protoheme IX farnesyltransferase|nr:heme o synthase [Candidatus Limnocylindria bacterium]